MQVNCGLPLAQQGDDPLKIYETVRDKAKIRRKTPEWIKGNKHTTQINT
jgi:hypothetical protein